jgi:DNA-3-methyladenine glycosylase I
VQAQNQIRPAPCARSTVQNRAVADLILDPDGLARCWWCGDDPLYRSYHDDEWGRERRGDDALFELLSLEGFQAGLSWLTILRKRESFRQAFAGFSIERVADFDERDIDRLLGDAGIIRHRGKIEATIGNAAAALKMADGLSEFVWSFAPARRSVRPSGRGELHATTPESTTLSKELKRRGFRFVGPTTVYAFMQSAGLVDDHLFGCYFAESVG